jgi:hypothetical protein
VDPQWLTRLNDTRRPLLLTAEEERIGIRHRNADEPLRNLSYSLVSDLAGGALCGVAPDEFGAKLGRGCFDSACKDTYVHNTYLNPSALPYFCLSVIQIAN